MPLLSISSLPSLPILVLALLLSSFSMPAFAAATGGNSAEITKKTGRLNVNITYPVLNVELVDKDIAKWAEGLVSSVEDMLEKDQAEGMTGSGNPYELRNDYELSYPSAEAVSIIFTVATYTGGAHDNIDIIVLSYELNSGELLSLEDIFKDQESALNIMSSYTYKALAARFGEDRIEDMLRTGTTPDTDNFSSISLNKNGICVHFQPYQAAPWSYGAQKVEIPLDEFQEAEPRLSLWGKK